MKKSINKIANDLGNLADSMDNILEATDMLMPEKFHLEQIRDIIKNRWSKQLKEIYIELTDENPWEDGNDSAN